MLIRHGGTYYETVILTYGDLKPGDLFTFVNSDGSTTGQYRKVERGFFVQLGDFARLSRCLRRIKVARLPEKHVQPEG